MFKTYISKIVQWRLLVILAVLSLTALLVTQMRHLKVVIDPNQMLPQEHPYVVGTNLAEKVFGSNYVLVIGVAPKSGSIYQSAVMERVKAISEGLQKIPHVKAETLMSLTAKRAKGISGTDDGLVVKPFFQNSNFDAESLNRVRNTIDKNPIYTGVVVSENQDMAAISISVEKGPTGFTPILKAVYELTNSLATDQIQIAVSGTPMFVYYVEKYTQRMAFLFPIALLLVGLLHLEAFRTWQGFFLPLVTAFLSVLWGLGLMGLSKVSIDAFNASTPILILAVTAGHAVQLLKRYYEEFDHAIQRGLAPVAANKEAVISSMTKVGPVMLAAGLVAVLGFFSLMTFNVATIRNFGVFTGLGILSGLIIELTFIPAVRSWMKPPSTVTKIQKIDIWGKVIAFVKHAIQQPSRAKVFGAFFLIAVLAGYGVSLLKVENSNKSFFAQSLPFQADDRLVNEKMGGTNTLYIVFEGDQADVIKDPKVLHLIDDTQRFLEGMPGIGKTISIVDMIKRMNQAMHSDKAQQLTIPDRGDLVSQYLLLYSLSGEPSDFDRYVDYNYRFANITAFVKYDNSSYIQNVIHETEKFLQSRADPRLKIHFGGSVPQSTALSETLVKGKLQNVMQIGLVIFGVSALIFRSLLAGILVITPLAITALMNFGLMGLTGIPLNTPNAVTAPMAIGIGADYAIYLLYRIREELAHRHTLQEAVDAALSTAGRAVLYVGSAIAGGYSVLMLSAGFNIHIWSGILIVLSMAVSVITTLLLLTSITLTLKPSFLTKRKAQSITLAGVTRSAVPVLAGLCVALGLLVSNKAFALTTDAVELMEKNYLANRFDDSISSSTFSLINKNGDKRVRTTFGATKMQGIGVDTKRVTRFLSPSDIRNTTTLMVEHSDRDDDIWIYLPALKKTRRLSSANKSESFVGTDLSYGDVIGHRVAEWSHKIVGTEAVGGVQCTIVESIPLKKETMVNTGYGKRINWIDPKSNLALRAEFYDGNMQLLKTSSLSGLVNVDVAKNRWQPMHMEVENVQTGHKTIIEWKDFKANQGLNDSYFSNRYLEKEE